MSVPERRVQISHDQNWIQLGLIISTGFTLPMIAVGNQLAIQYGTGQAISSILVGNLILWLIGMSVISIAMKDRSNALENMMPYIGKYGVIFVWLIFMVSLLNWFVHEINSAIPALGSYFGFSSKASLVRLGTGLGFFAALLSVGGIGLIKKLAVSSFVFIFFYHVYPVLTSHPINSIDSWGLSLPAVLSVVLVLFPGIVNLPTLFRHARSKGDCYLGLTVMTLLLSIYQISAIWMKFTGTLSVIYFVSTDTLFSFASLIYVLLSLIVMNLLNIYFASACWETFIPRFEGAKGYAIIGLMGTASYTFIQVYTPIRYLQELTNSYLASLGAVLFIAYLVRIIVQHRPRKYEKALNGICWLCGCVVSTIVVTQSLQDDIHPLFVGAAASAAAFLCIIFIEENAWAVRKILITNRKNA